jgi:signal transduction histidine kinase
MASGAAQMKILVVDDRVENRYLLEKQLEAEGYTVVSARDGVEALQQLEQHKVDMVISDILMPQMDGFQLCHELKLQEKYRQILFVFYTATYTDKKDEDAAMSLGASRFIVKPQEPAKLMATIKEVISAQATANVLAPPPLINEGDYLKTYNERLIRKLEHKVEQFESSSRELHAMIASKEREVAERKRVEEDLKKNQRDLQSLASRLLLLEERERKNFSQLLHDHIGQNLTYTKMKLDMLRKKVSDPEMTESVAELLGLVEQMCQETRSLTYELSPPLLYEIGLDAALEWLCEHFQKRYALPCTFEGCDRAAPIDVDVRVVLFQCIRELLFNVVKHAQAKSAQVSSYFENGRVRLTVSDDGIGLNQSKMRMEGSCFGLFNVRERMAHIGGEFGIESAPGTGTCVTLIAKLSD